MHQKNFSFHSALPQVDEQDGFIDLDRLMAIVIRRFRTIVTCVVVFVALAVAFLLFATPSYTSMTQILLDETMTKYAEDQPPAHENPDYVAKYEADMARVSGSVADFGAGYPVPMRIQVTSVRGF